MEIERDILNKLKEELKKEEITALIGSRQVGKTTLLEELHKEVEKEAIYISFDNIEILNQFEEDIERFIQLYINDYRYVFIDEFQYAKQGGRKLKYIYDKFKTKKIFISGSSCPELAIHSLQYLVGRVKIIEIYPLTFREFIRYKDKIKFKLLDEKHLQDQKTCLLLKNLFEEYLQFGAYPKIVKTKNLKEKEEQLKNLVNSYLLKEIKDVLSFKNIFEYETMLKRVAISNSNLINATNISLDLGINRMKIKQMLTVLKQTYIIEFTQPYLSNKLKQQIKTPKLYMQDLGFKNSLTNNFNNLNLRVDKGSILESFVVSVLRRKNLDFYFWNFDNKFEMDFVLEMGGKVFGIECKSKLKSGTIPLSTKRFIEKYNPAVVIIANENIDFEIKYNETKVIFTNYINLVNLEKLLKF
jgi:uncharacterized protein